MYRNFFGFNVKPFELTPDSNFLYLSPDLREVFATLEYGIIQRRGFVLLVGQPGTGKTTLINSLIDKSDLNSNFAYIFNPDLNFNELLHTILIEFNLASVDEDLSKPKAMHRLNKFVNAQFEKDRNAVIIVDEAQCLDRKTLEKLRLLSNLETRKEKLIQIILSGQPELENTLSQKSLTQLAQRIGLRCRTKPLKEKEAYEYMDHRLKVAGYKGQQLIANKARYLIWEYSKGIPRVINIICDNSLLTGYGKDQKRIDSSIVKEVIDDLDKVPLDNIDYPQDKSKDTIEEVSQRLLYESDEIREVSPELSERKDGDSSDIIDKLRKKLSRNQESEPVAKKERRFSAAWIAVIAGVALTIIIFILFLFIGSFKEFKNEFSSKLEAIKNNFQSQLSGIENSINKAPSEFEPTIDKSLPASRPDVEDDREKNTAAKAPSDVIPTIDNLPVSGPDVEDDIEKNTDAKAPSDVKPTIDKSLPVSSPDVEAGRKKNTVIVNKGETLYRIILKVYGKADPKILDAILKINPEIKNPNFIFENQVIKLPEKVDLN